MKRPKFNVYRDGKIHVCKSMCATCIFRPGNLMHLEDERRGSMVREAVKEQTAIICHSTLNTRANAVCHGFFKLHSTLPLAVASLMGAIEYDEPRELHLRGTMK
jgi:hypothetical protein